MAHKEARLDKPETTTKNEKKPTQKE